MKNAGASIVGKDNAREFQSPVLHQCADYIFPYNHFNLKAYRNQSVAGARKHYGQIQQSRAVW